MSVFPTLFISHGVRRMNGQVSIWILSMAAFFVLAALTIPIHAKAQASVIMLSRPITLVQGTQVGKSRFASGDTAKGGNGQPVDGIAGSSQEMLKTHFHAHLSLFYKGEQIAIPAGVGIVGPFSAKDGFVGDGRGFYWLHTHDATGIVHIESPDDRTYTLGNFFDIWGQPLDEKNVAGLAGPVRAFVDGKAYTGNIRDITFKTHEEITLVVGSPVPVPPRYQMPQGL